MDGVTARSHENMYMYGICLYAFPIRSYYSLETPRVSSTNEATCKSPASASSTCPVNIALAFGISQDIVSGAYSNRVPTTTYMVLYIRVPNRPHFDRSELSASMPLWYLRPT